MRIDACVMAVSSIWVRQLSEKAYNGNDIGKDIENRRKQFVKDQRRVRSRFTEDRTASDYNPSRQLIESTIIL